MTARTLPLAAGLLALALLPGCESQMGESHPLRGTKAPLFTATMLDGGSFDLADHLGRHVVILDFWATWCGPCRQALPILSQVASEYEDQGVRLFAVDLQENPEEVRQFLAETSLDLSVVMDSDGAIGSLYSVESIPQTVIIGREGRVAVVHIGFSGGLRSQLTHELEGLLAGQQQAGWPARSTELALRGDGSP